MSRGTWKQVVSHGLLPELRRLAPQGRVAVNDLLRRSHLFGFLFDPVALLDEVDEGANADEYAEWFHANEAAGQGLQVLARMAA